MAHWTTLPCRQLNLLARDAASQRQHRLTKPSGSLGRLEELAITLAAMQATASPRLEKAWILVFAADHGVAAQGVSAYPQAVTGEMVRNFASGGAAIAVLANSLGAELEVINLGTLNDPGPIPGVLHTPIAPSTGDFTHGDAMTAEQLEIALTAGAEAVRRAVAAGADLLIGGDMGIGNTTSATAMACALLRLGPITLAGPGTGLGREGVSHKASVIAKGLEFHGTAVGDPRETLRCLGGFEIAALVGAFLSAAQAGLPLLVDGYIASVAALTAVRFNPGCRGWMLFAHRSAEPGHQAVLEALQARPLLDLGMRLGEGSGAAVALPLLRLACDLHNRMATFAEAGVSGGEA